MEEKVKVNGKETVSNEVKESISNEVKEKVQTKLYLKREPFPGNDGKEYYSYVIRDRIEVKGKNGMFFKDIRSDFMPKDKGGYEVLDFIFEISDNVELLISEETMVDSDGRKTKYKVYTARAVNEDGLVFECGVKPSRDSDKSLLQNLLIVRGIY